VVCLNQSGLFGPVNSLSFASNGLSGSIPESLGQLELIELDLASNALTALPASLFALSSLIKVDAQGPCCCVGRFGSLIPKIVLDCDLHVD